MFLPVAIVRCRASACCASTGFATSLDLDGLDGCGNSGVGCSWRFLWSVSGDRASNAIFRDRQNDLAYMLTFADFDDARDGRRFAVSFRRASLSSAVRS